MVNLVRFLGGDKVSIPSTTTIARSFWCAIWPVMSTSSNKTAGLIEHHHSGVLQTASLDVSGCADMTPSTVLFLCLWEFEVFNALILHLILNSHCDENSALDDMTARHALPYSLTQTCVEFRLVTSDLDHFKQA